MRKFILAALILVFGVSAVLGAQQTVRVKSAAEFVRAIGSDKIIEIVPGLFPG